jgi:hypothetical protein
LAWTTEQEFAKDVTALANHLGELLLIGVDEQDGAASEGVPTVTDPDREMQRLGLALVNHAAPVLRAVFVPTLSRRAATTSPSSSRGARSRRAPSRRRHHRRRRQAPRGRIRARDREIVSSPAT